MQISVVDILSVFNKSEASVNQYLFYIHIAYFTFFETEFVFISFIS